MHDPEIQFRAPRPASLADTVRDAVGEEGRRPSRRRVRDWVLAGRVRVEGEIEEDPARLLEGGETVDVGPPDLGATAPPTPATSRQVEGVLHLDRHLLVVAYEPPVVVSAAAEAVQNGLERALSEAAVSGLTPRPVPRPTPRASGLVAAALSKAAEAALVEAFAAGAATLGIVAQVDAGATADLADLALEETSTGLRVHDEAATSVPDLLADLEQRRLAVRAVPGPGPDAVRPLLVHVAALALPHPRTGRALSWRLGLPPAFGPDLG